MFFGGLPLLFNSKKLVSSNYIWIYGQKDDSLKMHGDVLGYDSWLKRNQSYHFQKVGFVTILLENKKRENQTLLISWIRCTFGGKKKQQKNILNAEKFDLLHLCWKDTRAKRKRKNTCSPREVE